MRGIANFFTLFWCIYFPTCIAYNDLPGFSSVDEIMTIVLFVYTFMQYGRRYTNKKPWNEYFFFLVVLSFYTIYSWFFGVNVHNAVYLCFIQTIRPFTIIYCTWILNPQFTKLHKKIMLTTMIITLFSWVVYHPETYSGREAEFAVLGQLAACTGMAWYLMMEENDRNKWIACLLMLVGLLAPKFKFMGEVVCFFYFVVFLKKKLNFRSSKTIVSLLIMLTIILYVTWFKFDVYYVSGMDNEELARPMTYKTAWKLLWDYFPFGPGMGSFAEKGAMEYYSPLYYEYGLNKIWGLTPMGTFFIADAFYPSLAQFGIVGAILFVIFWKRRLTEFVSISDMRYYKMAFMAFLCLAIEQTADSSWLSGKGMGYCMIIALCLNANRENRTKNIRKCVEPDSSEGYENSVFKK